jgi:regulator of sigma E protease
MLILKILLGLLGLGIVVFVHELGHFIAARMVGIDVVAFSIGWGNALIKKTIGGVEYRLSMFPIGGYCKMRGENEFAEAWENHAKVIPQVKGTFLGSAPWRRIIVSLAGPFSNILFAVVVFTAIWLAGFEMTTLDNRIVLVSAIDPSSRYPADDAGLKTGDRIVQIDGAKVTNYHEIQSAIAAHAKDTLDMEVERDGSRVSMLINPELDKSTGAGKIGVYFWVDPVIDTVGAGSAAEAAGLRTGDRILLVNGERLPYTVAMPNLLEKGSGPLAALQYEREGSIYDTAINLDAAADGSLGISWLPIRYRSPRYSIAGAVIKGAGEAWNTFYTSLYSLTLLFKGIDLTQAVSGPVRITYMAGDVATESFSQGIWVGFRSFFNFLSLISIALAVMNLLPLPVLDGGLVLLSLIEAVRRRPLHPRFVTAFQTVGVVLICGIMIFTVFGDILFLVKR